MAYVSRRWREMPRPELSIDSTWNIETRLKYPKNGSILVGHILHIDDLLCDRKDGTTYTAMRDHCRTHIITMMRRAGTLYDVLASADKQLSDSFNEVGLSQLYPYVPRLIAYEDYDEAVERITLNSEPPF